MQKGKKQIFYLFKIIYSFYRVDLLGLFIQVLELISEDKELKSYLTKEAAALTSISTKNAAITTEDLPQVFSVFL